MTSQRRSFGKVCALPQHSQVPTASTLHTPWSVLNYRRTATSWGMLCDVRCWKSIGRCCLRAIRCALLTEGTMLVPQACAAEASADTAPPSDSNLLERDLCTSKNPVDPWGRCPCVYHASVDLGRTSLRRKECWPAPSQAPGQLAQTRSNVPSRHTLTVHAKDPALRLAAVRHHKCPRRNQRHSGVPGAKCTER